MVKIRSRARLLAGALWVPTLAACLAALPARGETPPRESTPQQLRVELDLLRDTWSKERAHYSDLQVNAERTLEIQQRTLENQAQEIAKLRDNLSRVERAVGFLGALAAVLILCLVAPQVAAVLSRRSGRPRAQPETPAVSGALQERLRAAELRLRALEREVRTG